MAPGKEPPELTMTEAQRRIDAIAPMLLWDVRRLLDTRSVMDAANRMVIARGLVVGPRAEPYNVIQQRLAMMLAVDLARVFDVSAGKRLDSQDKASIPILAHHLRRADVRASLEERARSWVAWLADENAETCAASIDDALSDYDRLMSSDEGRKALERLRELRTQRLAHSLIDTDPARPFYSDLFMLADFARSFVTRTTSAIMGNSDDLSDREGYLTRSAEAFWAAALDASLLPTSAATPGSGPPDSVTVTP
jgi:hypothetical protein